MRIVGLPSSVCPFSAIFIISTAPTSPTALFTENLVVICHACPYF